MKPSSTGSAAARQHHRAGARIEERLYVVGDARGRSASTKYVLGCDPLRHLGLGAGEGLGAVTERGDHEHDRLVRLGAAGGIHPLADRS